MCRIHGYWGQGFDPVLLEAARDAQLPGGPDHQRHVLGQGWGLGCNRLSIQDPHTGFQPFANAGGSVHLVFNGEIYNFRQIRDELAGHGVHVDGDSDGSVLLPYYELHGDSFVDRLEGMFAIAVADLRQRPRLKLWCDRLAVKSLYYTVTDEGLAFASEPRALAALVKRPLDTDPAAVDHYLNWQCMPTGTSLHRGVSSLHPGGSLVYDGAELTVRRPSDDDAPPSLPCTPEGLRALLGHEIGRMSLQSAPIAVQLSGGLDSSLLATLLRERRGDVTGFHVTHEGGDATDELVYARAAADHAGIPLRVVHIRQADLPELITSMVTALGSPNATPHALSADVLFREISADGFRVCFVGDGADEQFGGYRRYSTALAAGDDWPHRYLDRLSLVPEQEYRRLYTADYRDLVDAGVSSRQHQLELLRRPSTSRLEQILTFDRLHKLPSLNLRKLDHLSMAHSVEGRVPYCQPEVTRFARHTPDVLKAAGPGPKQILWESSTGLIPPSVRSRPKQPFTFPVGVSLAAGTPLWDFVADVLHRPRLVTAGYLAHSAVRRVFAEHAEGVEDHARLLWGLMVLELSLS
ncbi:asparagine synthase (glutamine-hydrolyzing) [Umezawaea tangerina]|uniref:asparagine synthase (glutamine-hydrolyzing) n=1 Tax=Umezawaea tangerina TaxID=84725 RepID=A0A2T0SVS1_9PSEU|nr:asparagine synthase (glutamine-hydrolyzing) [Umezawaea tangerina]PRY37505.1 asparagine synthase (glutamine-hydrolysing) [Umezawaea tangerina]